MKFGQSVNVDISQAESLLLMPTNMHTFYQPTDYCEWAGGLANASGTKSSPHAVHPHAQSLAGFSVPFTKCHKFAACMCIDYRP